MIHVLRRVRRDQLEIILISQTNDKVELERKENRLAENGKFPLNCHVYLVDNMILKYHKFAARHIIMY